MDDTNFDDRDDFYYDDGPGPDEPENRLHLDELHPLVQRAVHEAWDRGDYHEAIIAAWTALRDRLRERLASNADGIDLVESIYGRARNRNDPPRLPLTDFDSETSQGMHHGLVFLLRGIVLYVRNPEQHENSVVANDKVAAFERLALISLCAHHVDVRTEPISVAEAVDELRQERFPNTVETRGELIAAVPAAQHLAFAQALVEATRNASDPDEAFIATRCRTTHRQLSKFIAERRRIHVLAQIAHDIDGLICRDETLDFGIRFVTPEVFPRLASRNQRKVVERILEDLEEGTRTRRAQSGVLHRDAPRIFPALVPQDRQKFLRLVESALADDDPQRCTYGTWIAAWINDELTPSETARLANAVVEAIAAGSTEVVAELERRRRTIGYRFRNALHEALTETEAATPDAEAQIADARQLVAPITIRRVRSSAERRR